MKNKFLAFIKNKHVQTSLILIGLMLLTWIFVYLMAYHPQTLFFIIFFGALGFMIYQLYKKILNILTVRENKRKW